MITGSPAGPLEDLRVVVTRAARQAEPTVAAFASAGAAVERLPLLEVVPPDDPAPFDGALAALHRFAWIAFTSANAVEAVFGRPGDAPRVGAAYDSPRVASVGGATSEALRAHGVEPHLEAANSRAQGLAAELATRLERGPRILLPQAADALPTLEEELRAAGADPVRVTAYAKRVPPGARRRAGEIFGAPPVALGWVTFTSPSIARAFADLWGDDWPLQRRGLFAASIGPVTSAALRELGVEPAAEAARSADEEMVAAVAAAVAARDLGRA